MRLQTIFSSLLLVGGLLSPQMALAQSAPSDSAETAPYLDTLSYEEYMSLGYAATQRGDYYEATRYFRAALYVNPEDRSATVAYWNAYDALSTNQEESSSTYDQQMNQGYDATEAGNYQTALDHFQRALNIRPGDYYATQAIRNVRTYINSDQAVEAPQASASQRDVQPSLQPFRGEVPYDRYMRLGYAALQEEQFTTAVDYFRSALYERPNDRRATIAYWNAVDGLQDGTAGLDDEGSTQASYDRLMRLGYDANQRGDYETALSLFRRALERRPNDTYARNAIQNVTTYLNR